MTVSDTTAAEATFLSVVAWTSKATAAGASPCGGDAMPHGLADVILLSYVQVACSLAASLSRAGMVVIQFACGGGPQQAIGTHPITGGASMRGNQG
jgi:hypothetical protein